MREGLSDVVLDKRSKVIKGELTTKNRLQFIVIVPLPNLLLQTNNKLIAI